ncbi:MAG: hypothetical protein ACLFQJ_07670 [Campylobacterales bacterium]
MGILGALASSIISVFVVDNVLFMGVFSTYIREYDIDVYYNPFFWDNQNILILLIATAVFFLLYFFKITQKIAATLFIALTVFAASSFISIVGNSMGEMMFYQKGVEITTTNNKKMVFDIVFSDREFVYLKNSDGEVIRARRESSN